MHDAIKFKQTIELVKMLFMPFAFMVHLNWWLWKIKAHLTMWSIDAIVIVAGNKNRVIYSVRRGELKIRLRCAISTQSQWHLTMSMVTIYWWLCRVRLFQMHRSNHFITKGNITRSSQSHVNVFWFLDNFSWYCYRDNGILSKFNSQNFDNIKQHPMFHWLSVFTTHKKGDSEFRKLIRSLHVPKRKIIIWLLCFGILPKKCSQCHSSNEKIINELFAVNRSKSKRRERWQLFCNFLSFDFSRQEALINFIHGFINFSVCLNDFKWFNFTMS